MNRRPSCGVNSTRPFGSPPTSWPEKRPLRSSAGHTGATVMAAYAAFGMMPGVDRPALATTFPTRGKPAALLDAGANVQCRPPPASICRYGQRVRTCCTWRRASPRGAVHRRRRNQGERSDAGGAPAPRKAAPLNFIGNVEGREIYSGIADVVVCDGFTGNVVLKTSEGSWRPSKHSWATS